MDKEALILYVNKPKANREEIDDKLRVEDMFINVVSISDERAQS